MRRNDRDGYRVQFSFESRKNVDRTFDSLNDAMDFRDIIQKSIDNCEDICPIFVDLFKNDMKHIAVTKYGKYQLIIQKPTLKFNIESVQCESCEYDLFMLRHDYAYLG